ncbi:DUF4956 domain-containing protein [Nocardioides sp. SYSU D00065]|uniref:DUF4956 domain-containing protein n=1 Tax=Nocardioides sp. SYSU D00065 TaxID=2817378 RepID=UPI001B339642|nr:DUF4956 domain-containing protein [Nocardioides sp. SYSU D00065]
MTEHLLPIACDVVAITAIAALYFRRHQRRDLLLAYVALNIGILSVTAMLTSSTAVGVGLGLGLFGILSIIRLRSDMITQEEIAYYFVALALGLLAGVGGGPPALVPVLTALLVAVMYVADHPRLLPRARRQLLTLDTAIADEAVLRDHIRHLGIDVRHLIVQELDLVRDLTVVDVRYRARSSLVPLVAPDLPATTSGTAPATATATASGPTLPAATPLSDALVSLTGRDGDTPRTSLTTDLR